jgi:prophage tail gpP-like protein
VADRNQDLPLTVTLHAVKGHSERSTTDLQSWFIDTSYLTSTDGFEFTLFESDQGLTDGLELRPVTLSLDGQQQLSGRIDVTEVGEQGTAVTCRGRDFLADIVECNIDPVFAIRDEMTLEQVLLSLFGPCGITKIVDDADDYDLKKTMRDLRTGIAPAKKGKRRRKRKTDPLKDYQPKPGEGLYEYAMRLCARMAVTIQPGPDRQTVFLTAPHYDESPVYEPLRRYRDPALNTGNNIVRAVAVRDFSRLPSFALFSGTAPNSGKKGEPISKEIDVYGLAGSIEIADAVTRSMATGRIQPEKDQPQDGKLYRLLSFRDTEARTQEQLENAIRRAIADRMKDTLAYRVTVKGHKDPVTDAIWSVDTMVQIEDEIAAVNEPLWIAKRTLRFDRDKGGATTDLECWRPHSFVFIDETEAA